MVGMLETERFWIILLGVLVLFSGGIRYVVRVLDSETW